MIVQGISPLSLTCLAHGPHHAPAPGGSGAWGEGPWVTWFSRASVRFTLPACADANREVRASYTRERAKLTMIWTGVGTTVDTAEGNTFTMGNEGMVLVCRK